MLRLLLLGSCCFLSLGLWAQTDYVRETYTTILENKQPKYAPYLSEVLTYGAAGRLLAKQEITPPNQRITRYYQYDKKGELVQETLDFGQEQIQYQVEETYKKKQLQSRLTLHDKEPIRLEEWEYNSEGAPQLYRYYEPVETLRHQTTYRYDAKGRLVEERTALYQGQDQPQAQQRIVYRYNDMGDMDMEEHFIGERLHKRTIHFYNVEERLRSSTITEFMDGFELQRSLTYKYHSGNR